MVLCENLQIECPDFSEYINKCNNSLSELKKLISDTPIAIDYTAFSRPLSLARLLLDNNFNVQRIYADVFTTEEEQDYMYLKENYPELLLYPTVNVCMRVQPRMSSSKVLAIGQKAAYFCGTGYFVNIVENGGYYGFEAILMLCREMRDAYLTPKDTKQLIQIKGMGCCGCV